MCVCVCVCACVCNFVVLMFLLLFLMNRTLQIPKLLPIFGCLICFKDPSKSEDVCCFSSSAVHTL